MKTFWMADSKQNNSKKTASYAGKTCQGKWTSEEYKPGLVSVIIPTYNREWLIAEALESVRAQTYRVAKPFLVDDRSNSETPS